MLELGGNAAVVVDQDADLDDAVERIVFGAFYQSGQSCIGVQRILVHESIYDAFKAMLVAKTKTLVAGDPHDRETFIGPMISEKEATRLEGWIDEAVAAGATLLCGGKRDGAMLEATLLEDVPKVCAANREEAFGPVAILTQVLRLERGARGGQRQQVRPPGRHVHPRPAQGARSVGPARGRRRGGQRRLVDAASTTCPTAGSRIPASAAKASASRWRT